ncbi:hypothetical protein EGW08_022759 [Elysia chlorotica]|uniref:PNK FHA domain-containing protein n=1 Tax=Elysia chlorotica TaxID=188477 RepID=A0A3S1GZX4_ELYCH|nr:hypothetical protein EGW08_022759 [Elysia chlorotica]
MSRHKTTTISCHLVCLQHTHHPIALPDGETVIIGRAPLTKIIDPRCSRNQVSLTADWTKREVKLIQLGVNDSSVDGKDVGKDNELIVKSSSTIFLISGAFPHRINFKCTSKREDSASPSTPKATNKRSHNGDLENSHIKKKKLESSHETAKNGQKEKECKKKHEISLSLQDNDGDKSDDDVSEKMAQLTRLKNEALKEVPTSSGSKTKHSNRRSCSSPSSSQATEKSEWTSHDELQVFTSKGVTPHRKVAAFDMDGTIILTRSGKVFPTDQDDWKILHPNVFNKIKELHSKRYKIVFFTNQLGVAKGKTNIEELKVKIENIVEKLQVPVQVFVATHEGKYRKPCDGMWEKLCKSYNNSKEIDLKASFYVGDAAGRKKDWAPKKKKDFSCSDRLFASNVGVAFFTPEEFFLNEKPTNKFVMPHFDPRKLDCEENSVPSDTFASKKKEVAVLVGFPACGKSYFASHTLKPKGYKIVSRDELGSWQKCVQKAKHYLTESSVAVDNTNLSVEERAR